MKNKIYILRQSDNEIFWFVEEKDTNIIVKIFWDKYQAIEYVENEEKLIELIHTNGELSNV